MRGIASRSTLPLGLLLLLGCNTSAPAPDLGSMTSQDGGDQRDVGTAETDAGLVIDQGVADTGPAPDAGPPIGALLRVVAANLTSGNFQNYDPGHGLRIMEALVADVILIQEFNYQNNTEPDLRTLVDQVCGVGCEWTRGETGSIPNGVISRWPILEAGTWVDNEVGNRGFDYARIDLPGAVDLWAVSVHFLTRNAGVRSTEAQQLVDYIQAQVPVDDYLVIGGDLNTNSRTEGALQTLGAVVDVASVPADADGNGNTNRSRNQPYDWVMPDPDLAAFAEPVQLAEQTFAQGLVFDTRIFDPISAVPPALAEDSDGPQMQHMAVVRDFRVP